jgi:hypothetical protein
MTELNVKSWLEIGHVNATLKSIYTLVWFHTNPAGLLNKQKMYILFNDLA